jgi:hypothetical protein
MGRLEDGGDGEDGEMGRMGTVDNQAKKQNAIAK